MEDIPDILILLKTTLEFKGYRVVTARDGQEAMEVLRRERPAVIVTDILMPRMDGFNLVHRLRIDPVTRDIPVIFLSATYVAPEDKIFDGLRVVPLFRPDADPLWLIRSLVAHLAALPAADSLQDARH